MKAIEVGVFCLERGRTAQDTDFVKRKMTELLSQVEQAVVDIPARTEKTLLRQIGADDGQVLSPVKKLVNTKRHLKQPDASMTLKLYCQRT